MAAFSEMIIAKDLLGKLKKIRSVGLNNRVGLCVHINVECKLSGRDRQYKEELMAEAVRDWPLSTGMFPYPINACNDKSSSEQYVQFSTYRTAPDFAVEYRGLRWHLLHHCIMYVEDLIDELKQEQQT